MIVPDVRAVTTIPYDELVNFGVRFVDKFSRQVDTIVMSAWLVVKKYRAVWSEDAVHFVDNADEPLFIFIFWQVVVVFVVIDVVFSPYLVARLYSAVVDALFVVGG